MTDVSYSPAAGWQWTLNDQGLGWTGGAGGFVPYSSITGLRLDLGDRRVPIKGVAVSHSGGPLVSIRVNWTTAAQFRQFVAELITRAQRVNPQLEARTGNRGGSGVFSLVILLFFAVTGVLGLMILLGSAIAHPMRLGGMVAGLGVMGLSMNFIRAGLQGLRQGSDRVVTVAELPA
jgi:hypothetical protein